MAWWQVTQRSARFIDGTQICCMPTGTVRALSAPYFSATRCLNVAWYQRHSCSRSLRRKRTVATTSTRPITASTGRSSRGYGESVRFSMSDPRGQHGPGLPGPVELPGRAAQERADDGQHHDDEHHQQEDGVLPAAVAVEPDAGRVAVGAVEPGPGGQQADEEAGQDHAAQERPVHGEAED